MTFSRSQGRARGVFGHLLSGLVAASLAAVAAGPASARPPGMSETQAATERSAIVQLFNWTLIAFDNRDIDAFLARFTADGMFEVLDADAAKHVSMTRAQMRQVFGGQSRADPTRHLPGPISVVFADSSHATLNGYVVWLKSADGKTFVVDAPSSYDIKLEKIGGKWMFAHYQLAHFGVGDRTSPLAAPAD